MQDASSWADLQLQSKAIGFMEYRNYRISIYEGVDALKPDASRRARQYFCTPIAVLLHQSAKYRHSAQENKHVVMLKVQLWSRQVQDQVLDYMNNKMLVSVNDTQVTPIHFEEIILSCSAAEDACRCSSEWQPYQLHNDMSFRMVCPSRAKALELERLLKSEPQQFEAVFKIKFNVATRKTQQKETAISVENVVSGDLFTRLDQRFPHAKEVYLTAEDTKKLLSESANKVVVQSFTENDVIVDGSEAAIAKILEAMMVSGSRRVDSESAAMWDSVFWKDDNYRPDRVASELSEVHNKSDSETQKRLLGIVSNANRRSTDVGFLTSQAKALEAAVNEKKETDTGSFELRGSDERNALASEASSKNQASQNSRNSVSHSATASGFGLSFGSSFGVDVARGSSSNNEAASRSSSSTASSNIKQNAERDRELVESGKSVGISGSTSNQANRKSDDQTSGSTAAENDDRHRNLGEALAKVEWNGEKFVAKPMTLSRINLSKIRNAQAYKDLKVSVTFSSAKLTMGVNIDYSDDGCKLSNTVEDRVGKLEEQLRLVRSSVSGLRPADRVFFFARTFLDVEGVWKRVTYGHSAGHTALDAKTGTFTAPRNGTFAFFFSALKKEADTAVSLTRNDREVTSMYHLENGQVSVSAVLSLKKGERVAVYLQFGKLKGNGWKPNYTPDARPLSSAGMQFTGFSGFSVD